MCRFVGNSIDESRLSILLVASQSVIIPLAASVGLGLRKLDRYSARLR